MAWGKSDSARRAESITSAAKAAQRGGSAIRPARSSEQRRNPAAASGSKTVQLKPGKPVVQPTPKYR